MAINAKEDSGEEEPSQINVSLWQYGKEGLKKEHLKGTRVLWHLLNTDRHLRPASSFLD